MKRSRSTNFAKEEELLLVEEIRKMKHIIENKTTNKISYKEKEQAWEQILLNFNSKTCKRRELDQIKSKYDNLKTKARKQVSMCRGSLHGTGGGPGYVDNFDDPVLKIILEIINIKTVIGLQSIFDSDNCNVVTGDELENDNLANNGVIDVIDISYLDTSTHLEMNINDVLEEAIETSTLESHTQDCEDTTDVMTSSQQSQLPSTSSKLAISGIPLMDTTKTKGAALIKKVENTPNKRSWTDYTPRCLKEPVSKKLRPTKPNPVFALKEEYYKQKIDFMKVQREELEKEVARKEEKHRKEMELLDLEIKLKLAEVMKKQT